jgi:hypothetical protein
LTGCTCSTMPVAPALTSIPGRRTSSLSAPNQAKSSSVQRYCRRHITSCHVTSSHVTSHQIMHCHVTLRHIMSHHVMSHQIMSCHVTLRHIMSHHDTSRQVASRQNTSLSFFLQDYSHSVQKVMVHHHMSHLVTFYSSDQALLDLTNF